MIQLPFMCFNIIVELCCLFTCLNWCGCIDTDVEHIQTERPVNKISKQEPNPFIQPVSVKDAHLQSAY